MARRFIDCCGMFEHHFIVRGHDVIHHARHYLSGLLGTRRRKNIECIAPMSPTATTRMQQFVSDSPGDHTAVMDQIAREAEATPGRDGRYGLWNNRRDFVREERRGVGRLQRQYCGRLGKVENLSGGRVPLAGARECGPRWWTSGCSCTKAWAKDAKRCAKAKVPVAHWAHRTKTGVGPGMVAAARARGSDPPLGGGDAAYGSNHAFTTALEDMGETFLMDVACKLRVWENDPGPQLPPFKPGRKGRPRKRAIGRPVHRQGPSAVRVDVLTTRNFSPPPRAK